MHQMQTEQDVQEIRVGIFSGVFDPVHKGHISFALTALREAKLDSVYFLVEAKPHRKTGVSHVAHRIAMAKLATAPYPKLRVLELPDKQFTVAKTLPRLNKIFSGSQLHFLCGSDMLRHMPDWLHVDRLLKQAGLVVGVREPDDQKIAQKLISRLPCSPVTITVINSPEPGVSSGQIREAIKNHKTAKGLLPSTQKYAGKHWLYELPSGSSSAS